MRTLQSFSPQHKWNAHAMGMPPPPHEKGGWLAKRRKSFRTLRNSLAIAPQPTDRHKRNTMAQEGVFFCRSLSYPKMCVCVCVFAFVYNVNDEHASNFIYLCNV